MKNFVEFLRSNDELSDKWAENFREFGYNDNNVFSDGTLTATVTEVEQYGGEGMGDEYYYVYKVECNDVVTFYKLNGWWASFVGSTFHDKFDLIEVEQVQVLVNEWRVV